MKEIKRILVCFFLLGFGMCSYSVYVVGDVFGAFLMGESDRFLVSKEYSYKFEHKRAKSSGPVWYVYEKNGNGGELNLISLIEVEAGVELNCIRFRSSCFSKSDAIFDYGSRDQFGGLFIGLSFILMALVVFVFREELLRIKEKHGE